MRFKQLTALEAYDRTTIDYTYDNTQRLLSANHNGGDRIHAFSYDLSGNRLEEDLSGTGVTDKLTEYEYNNANQISQMRVDGGSWTGFTYDNNGHLTDDGVNSYTWDRANRLLEMDTGTPAELTAYAYDGLNNRISQAIGTTSPVVTQYLLDTQPALTKVIGATVGGNTDRFIHAPRGIHSVENSSGSWRYALQDGLGSVRAEVDNLGAVQASQSYAPYGEVFGASGSFASPYGFSGEQTDGNGQVYLRARYYNPSIGVFNALDPFEGSVGRPMSLNGYSWVEGNVVNMVDPSGMCQQPTNWGDLVDINCYYSAKGLAERLARTTPYSYNHWFDILIKKPWHELKALEGVETAANVTGSANQFLDNASIIPTLMATHPELARQAIVQWGCQNGINLTGLFGDSNIAQMGSLTLANPKVAGATLLTYLLMRGLLQWGLTQTDLGAIALPQTYNFDDTQDDADDDVTDIPVPRTDNPDDDDENCEFVGYHGTSLASATDITTNGIDIARLDHGAQLGVGVYVTPQLNIANAYALVAGDMERSQMGVLRVCAIGFSTMSHIEVPEAEWVWGGTMPQNYLTAYDYLTSDIADTDSDRQIKFNLHVIHRLRFSLATP